MADLNTIAKTNRTVAGMMGAQVLLMALTLVTLTGCAPCHVRAQPPKAAHCGQAGAVSEAEIAALFDRWDQALRTGDAGKVAALYAERSILLPTVSDKPRLTRAEKEEYFRHFLEDRPSARIDLRQIETGRDMAVDSGLYTFKFQRTGRAISGRYSFTYRRFGRDWLIVSHHSSIMPETK